MNRAFMRLVRTVVSWTANLHVNVNYLLPTIRMLFPSGAKLKL
jgi:hypothetical protein